MTKKPAKILGEVLELVEKANLPPYQRRDMKSAINRIAKMAGWVPATMAANAPALRAMLKEIRPAAHGVSAKTWSNLVSRLRAALRLAGMLDSRGEGSALKDPAWASLLEAIADDKALSSGLAGFANFCSGRGIAPHQVDDDLLQRFHVWLENRTLCPKPKAVVQFIPLLWNKASERIGVWPKTKLALLSFKTPQRHLRWDDLAESLRDDAERYLAMRANPDVFDERPNAPKKPLALSTLGQQKENLRLSASVLVESGIPVEEINSLADLVQVERFKIILRHYHEQAGRQPNAFVTCLAQTLVQVASHHLSLTKDELQRLKEIAKKLPAIPLELTPKNTALVQKFESDALKAKLLFLPDELQAEVTKALEKDRILLVEAQMAIAIDIQIAVALRPQNLSTLNWRRHFLEPDGPRRRLILSIPKTEMKARKYDFLVELPDQVAQRIRWYRRAILPRLGADANGDLFVTEKGVRKNQRTLTGQMLWTAERRLGVHMTAHQFRHLLGCSYLDANPHDMETVRRLLGHSWIKTTGIYVGSGARRAGHAYHEFLFQKREALKLKRPHKRKATG